MLKNDLKTPEDIENFLKENNISSITELRSRTVTRDICLFLKRRKIK